MNVTTGEGAVTDAQNKLPHFDTPASGMKTAKHGPAQPRPLLAPFLVAHASSHVSCLFQMLGLWAASLTAAQPNSSAWGSIGYLALSVFELLTVGFDLDSLHGLLTKRLSNGQVLDRCLLIPAVVIPAFQTLLTLIHPPFLVTAKNWPAFAAFLMGMSVAVCRFPPAHSLVQWVLSSICYTILDCYGRRNCGHQQCPTSTLGHTSCFLSRGLLIAAAGLAAWVTAYVLVTRNSSRLRSQAESMTPQDPGPDAGSVSGARPGQQQQQQQPGSSQRETADAMPSQSSSMGRKPLPFESWGMSWPPAANRFFHRLDRSLTGLTEAVNEEVLVRLVCLPVMAYSLGFTLLARVQVQGISFCSMSPDTFLIYIMAWFMVGRNSSNFDISPLVLKIQAMASAAFARASHQPSLMELVERLRQHVTGGVRPATAPGSGHHITVSELLGEGAFGKVYKGVWRGTTVAVKRMVLPGSSNQCERRGRMAIMEAAISGALVHPNIVQTYTYTVQPVQGGSTGPSEVHVGDLLEAGRGVHAGRKMPSSEVPTASTAAEALEVQLVLEYMDCGTLRDVLDDGCFETAPPSEGGPSVNYYAVLETAADVAKGMMHLHSLNVIHCDLKARNVLLRSCASDPRSFIAKVGDFGLSLKLDSSQTSVDNCFHGTPSHMAPEVHTQGRQSKAADMFSFGITMWELYTGDRAFQGVHRALLSYYLAQGNRPLFPTDTPVAYAALAARCWDQDPEARPRFEQVVDWLLELIRVQSADIAPVPVTVLGAQVTVFRPLQDELLHPLQPQVAPAAAVGGVACQEQPGRVQRSTHDSPLTGPLACLTPSCFLLQQGGGHNSETNTIPSQLNGPEGASPPLGYELMSGEVPLADVSLHDSDDEPTKLLRERTLAPGYSYSQNCQLQPALAQADPSPGASLDLGSGVVLLRDASLSSSQF